MPHLSSRLTSRPLRIALLSAVVSLTLLAQACGSATANSRVNSRFFGMHVPDFSTTYPSALSGTVGAVDLTSDGVYWRDVEPTQGAWQLDKLTALVNQARSHHAQPLLVLGQTPDWATNSATSKAASMPVMSAWRTYVTKMVSTYGTRVDYQIWPEANISSNWRGSTAQLAKLVASASTIIHKQARRAVVVSPAMVTRMKYQRKFMDDFFARKVGGRRIGTYVDAVGLDLYPAATGTPEDSMKLLRSARSILRSHKVTAPVWNVEINYGVTGGGKPIKRSPSGATQAAYVARTYVLNAAANVKRVYWLGWSTYPTMGVAMADDSGRATRAGRAFLTTATWLDGRTASPCAVNRKRHLYTCRLVKKHTASWVYWTTRGKTTVRVPKGARHWTSTAGVTESTRPGKRLTVRTSPIWVH